MTDLERCLEIDPFAETPTPCPNCGRRGYMNFQDVFYHYEMTECLMDLRVIQEIPNGD